MDDEPINEKLDLTLGYLSKQDLYTLSVGDLEERIASLQAEITRCQGAISDRGDSKSAADKLFNL